MKKTKIEKKWKHKWWSKCKNKKRNFQTLAARNFLKISHQTFFFASIFRRTHWMRVIQTCLTRLKTSMSCSGHMCFFFAFDNTYAIGDVLISISDHLSLFSLSFILKKSRIGWIQRLSQALAPGNRAAFGCILGRYQQRGGAHQSAGPVVDVDMRIWHWRKLS